jgi:hypothetical protein
MVVVVVVCSMSRLHVEAAAAAMYSPHQSWQPGVSAEEEGEEGWARLVETNEEATTALWKITP